MTLLLHMLTVGHITVLNLAFIYTGLTFQYKSQFLYNINLDAYSTVTPAYLEDFRFLW
jgi:hypothetical protein